MTQFIVTLIFYLSNCAERDLDLEAAMKELNLVASDVAKLADDVGKFAGWWTGTETALSKAEKDARGLRPGKDRLRVKVIQKQWTIIRDDYKQYKAQVCRRIAPCPSLG